MTTIRQLDADERAALAGHFFQLSPADRRLRFGLPIGASAITDYVDGIDFGRDVVFGVYDGELVGVAHLALESRVAEVGLSVLPAHRGRGIGSALFARAATRARNRSMAALVMRCMTNNAPIIGLARRFGMDIVRVDGETEARLELPPVSLGSVAAELLSDALAPRETAAREQAAVQSLRMSHPVPQPRALLAGQDGTH